MMKTKEEIWEEKKQEALKAERFVDREAFWRGKELCRRCGRIFYKGNLGRRLCLWCDCDYLSWSIQHWNFGGDYNKIKTIYRFISETWIGVHPEKVTVNERTPLVTALMVIEGGDKNEQIR